MNDLGGGCLLIHNKPSVQGNLGRFTSTRERSVCAPEKPRVSDILDRSTAPRRNTGMSDIREIKRFEAPLRLGAVLYQVAASSTFVISTRHYAVAPKTTPKVVATQL